MAIFVKSVKIRKFDMSTEPEKIVRLLYQGGRGQNPEDDLPAERSSGRVSRSPK